jgi:hypothetical protein
METDPLDIHHIVIKNEVYEDDTDGIEVEPIPMTVKSEVFEDASDDIEVTPTPRTDSPNIQRTTIDVCCSSSASSLASGTPLVCDTDWDLNQCCRICAQKSSDLVSVFGEEGLFRQLMQKMKDCLQITVSASLF